MSKPTQNTYSEVEIAKIGFLLKTVTRRSRSIMTIASLMIGYTDSIEDHFMDTDVVNIGWTISDLLADLDKKIIDIEMIIEGKK